MSYFSMLRSARKHFRAAIVVITAVLLAGRPLSAQAFHTVLATDQSNNSFQSTSLCAMSCFAATYTFSTVPFFSLDQANSISLAYNGDRAFPRPFIIVDVDPDDSGVNATQFWLEATVNGSPVTFLNGNTRLYFTSDPGAVRLAGQFDASNLATGVYPMHLTIHETWPDGSDQADIDTELMIENESGSYFGRGWTIAGLQRLYTSNPAGGYMITEGDGTAIRFNFLNVAATDFSKLTFDGTNYTRTYLDGSRIVFNASGFLTSAVDADGRTTTFGYDGSGRPSTVISPTRNAGLPTPYFTLGYGSYGISEIRENHPSSAARITSVTVNAGGTLAAITDPDNVSTSFAYDYNARLSTVTDRRGGVTTFGYDEPSWKLVQITLPQVAIDAGGGTTTTANPVIQQSPWQRYSVPTSSTSSSSPWPANAPSQVFALLTDPENRTEHFRVNKYGQPIDITDKAGLRTQILMAKEILQSLITHPFGGPDTLEYDALGRLTMSHPAGGAVTNYGYGANGRLAFVTGAGDRGETLTYNANNQVSRISFDGPPAQTESFWYNPMTLLPDSVKDNAGHTSSFTYDGTFGNTQQVTAPGARTTTKVFDVFGRDSTVTTPDAITGYVNYDILNRPTSSSRAGATTSIAYDQLFATDLTDPNGNTYHTDYNPLGWPTRQCDANNLGSCATNRFDRSGLATSVTNRRGQIVNMGYDLAGRLISRQGTNVATNTFSYSTDGRTMVAATPVETDSVFVNPGTYTTPSTDSVVKWIDGRRFRIFHSTGNPVAGLDSTSIATNYGLVFNTRQFQYAGSGFLSTLTSGATATFTPDADGVGGSIFLVTNGTLTSAHTVLHSISQVSFDAPARNAEFRRAYHYDGLGRLDASTNVNADRQTPFSFQADGALANWQVRAGCGLAATDTVSGNSYGCSSVLASQSFTYDAAGNRTDLGGVPIGGNRYSSFNGASFTYDADGNVARKYKAGVYDRNYFWSAANQLDSTSDGSTRKHYDYNAFGEPVRISTNGAISSYLVWDGSELLAELDASGNRIADYTYAPSAIDAPFAVTTDPIPSAGTQYAEIDELGNVIGTSALGSVTQSVSYDAWGTPTISGSTANRLFWKGLMWESGPTQLYYMRNRWYDPEAGRFVSEDPMGQSGGINLYAFGENDPVNESDPAGLEGCTIAFGCLESVVTWGWPYSIPREEGASANFGKRGARGGNLGGVNTGGAGSGPGAGGGDVGIRAVGVCRAAIGLTAVSFFLESTGVAELYKGARAAAALRSTARFAATFGSVPDNIKMYTAGRATAAYRSIATHYTSGWGQMSAISFLGEAAANLEHTWWGYLPIPYSSTLSAGKAAAKACISPGG